MNRGTQFNLFEAGCFITDPSEVVYSIGDGKYYRWDGALPKQVPVGSTPKSTGGIGNGVWVDIGDASLRSDLGRVIKTYSNVSSMKADVGILDGVTVQTLGFYSAGDGGGATYEITSLITSNEFNLIKLSNGNVAKLINGNGNARRYGAKLDMINDDGAAINACIADSRTFEASSNDKGALTSVTIKPVPATRITLPLGFVIKLKDGSNVELLDSSDTTVKQGLQITGGIWDMNGKNQVRDNGRGYIGTCIRLADWKDLHLSKIIIKDPVSFGVQLGNIDRYTLRDIYLDYDNARPNMDGIHCNGGCRNGVIDNIAGVTNDDFVALNARDGNVYQLRAGPIDNIKISNIKSTGDSYRGVRLLSGGELIDNITIDGIYGDYRNANVAITRYTFDSGVFGRIVIDNMNGNLLWQDEAMLHIEPVNIESLTLKKSDRVAKNVQKEVVEVMSGAFIRTFDIGHINHTGNFQIPAYITNHGRIGALFVNGATSSSTNNYGPLLWCRSGSEIGTVTLRNIVATALRNIIRIDASTIGSLSCSESNIEGCLESPVTILTTSIVGTVTLAHGATTSPENMVRVAGSSRLTKLFVDGYTFNGNATLRDAITIIDTAYVQEISVNNCKAACRDLVHIESTFNDTFSVFGAGNSMYGVSRYPLYVSGQKLRVNSQQIGIDKGLVKSSVNGDVVFNNVENTGSIGLYVYQNGAWHK